MTTWDDLVEPDDPFVGALTRPRDAADATEAPADDPALAEGGMSDAWDSVHVWTDDEGRVSRVVVSTSWRERTSHPLASRILFAAQQATLVALHAQQAPGGAGRPETPPYAPIPLLDEPFADVDVDGLAEEALRLGEELQALDARDDVRAAVVHFTSSVGTSANGKVAVTLDAARRPCAVDIDERWVASARAERINASLDEAFAAAYAQWREPVTEPGEREELVARMEDLRRRVRRPLLIAGGWIDPREEDR